MNYRQWKAGRGWFLAVKAFPQWWRGEKKQGKLKIGLTCLGKRSHEVVDCAWREFDLAIHIFPLYELCEIPQCPFQHNLHLLKKSLKFAPKADDLFSMLGLAKTWILTAPGFRIRDPLIWVALGMKTKVCTNEDFTTVPAGSAAEQASLCRGEQGYSYTRK